MSGTQETLDSDDSRDDAVFEDEDELEQLATKRAGLTDRYNHHREKLRERAQQQASGDETDEARLHRLRERLDRVSDTLVETVDDLRDRGTAHRRTITDIETRPEIEATSLADAQASTEDIEIVRFVFDNGASYSNWYTWEPENPDHAINKLIDYYADGDLSQMYYKTVDVAPKAWARDTQYILFPEPYEKRTAHAQYRFLQPFMIADRPDEMDDGFRTNVTNQKADTVVSETTHSLEVGQTGALAVGTAAAFVSLAGLLVGFLGVLGGIAFGSSSPTAQYTPVLTTWEIIVPAVAVGLTLLIGGYVGVLLARTGFTRTGTDNGYGIASYAHASGLWGVLLVAPVIGPPVLFGIWLKQRARQLFDNLDTHNPY